MSERINSKVRTITTEELKDRLRSGNDFEFWNVLTDEWLENEMIPGSRRVSLDKVGHEAVRAKLARKREIVVYCGGPKCPQSRQAAEKLAALGFKNVAAYEGGLEEWKQAGYEVERLEAEAPAGV